MNRLSELKVSPQYWLEDGHASAILGQHSTNIDETFHVLCFLRYTSIR